MDPTTRLYEYLDECNREEVATYRQRGRRFNPSAIHQCSREIYYKHTGEIPRVIPGFISLYGQDGDICHDSVRWLLKKAGVELDWLEFKEETGEIKETAYFRKTINHNDQVFEISGRADGLIYLEDSKEWMPLEIKSVDGFKYKYILQAYQKGELFKYLQEGNKGKYLKWLMQTCLTTKTLGYDRTYLLFKDRSLCQIGMYDKVNDLREGGCILEIDDAMYEGMLNKMANITECVDKGEPPAREYLEGSYECDRLCRFSHVCRSKDG